MHALSCFFTSNFIGDKSEIRQDHLIY